MEQQKPDINSLSKELQKIGGKNNNYKVKLILPNKKIKNIKVNIDNQGKPKLYNLSKNDELNEGIGKNLMIGAVCTILASGMISCKKDVYDIGKDNRYIVKPQILNSLDKEYFDAPGNNSKDKVYLWYGNQGGNGSRPAYFDYTNKLKKYGTIQGKEYPDSVVGTGNGITPNEVIKVVSAKDTPYPLDSNDRKSWKYLALVKVHPSTQWDWTDPNNGKEVPFSWNTGYALYLTNIDGMQGELYPTFIERIYGLNRDSNGKPKDNPNYKPVIKPNSITKNYVDGNSSELMKEIPKI